MKHFIFLAFILVLSSCGASRRAVDTTSHAAQVSEVPAPGEAPVAPEAPAPPDYHDQTTWLLGYFEPSRMRQGIHGDWYFKGFDEYMPETAWLNNLLDIPHENLTLKIVMGTWCPDSRREVPRFMKILELWKFPTANTTFIGVDNAKIAPVGEYESLNIERVPTFIFYKNNFEAGRIIEVPKTSLEQDIVNILTGNE